MVILNGLKYACETCIKGHRSSACSHTDRTLFEIKRKGRPITQCEHCRHLRRTRQVHVKCLCGAPANDDKSKNRTRTKPKLSTSGTIRIGRIDLSHPTNTADLPSPKAKVRLESKDTIPMPKATPCNTRPSSPSPPLAPVTPSTPSCCSTKSHSSDTDSTMVINSPAMIDDKYTASLLDDLSRARGVNAVIPATSQHVQPFYNPTLSSTSFAWQSGVNLGSCSCGITCACPGCYEHSPSTSMILFSGENCPYSCTTCTACNGFGFTSPISGAFIVPAHSSDHWRQSSSSIVSTSAVSTSAMPGLENPSSISRCCGGPCKCIVCNCDKTKDGEELPERIGFAVSGERGGCCTDANPRIRYHPPRDRKVSSSTSASKTSTSDETAAFALSQIDSPPIQPLAQI